MGEAGADSYFHSPRLVHFIAIIQLMKGSIEQ